MVDSSPQSLIYLYFFWLLICWIDSQVLLEPASLGAAFLALLAGLQSALPLPPTATNGWTRSPWPWWQVLLDGFCPPTSPCRLSEESLCLGCSWNPSLKIWLTSLLALPWTTNSGSTWSPGTLDCSWPWLWVKLVSRDVNKGTSIEHELSW